MIALAVFAAMASPQIQAQPFPLRSVKLTGGLFAEANKLCAKYLLEIDPDRLLHSFRKHAGLEPKGDIYGGWENMGLAGHSLGHFLTACSQEFAASGDSRYKEKVDYIVAELTACQTARPDGYISAIPNGDEAWAQIKQGQIRSGGFDLNGMWAPWYTHHKVLAGLIDAHQLAGNQDALPAAERFAGWMIETTKDLSEEQWQQMLVCEYGGINEALADLFALTKNPRHLDLARKFYDKRVLDPLQESRDELQGKHSNTQIPKLIGLARLYEITGQERDRRVAEFFWQRMVKHHSYVIGGNSNHEYLGPPDKLSDRLSSNTAETCNTYNMLRLTRHVFSWNPRAEIADYYERAHLNHILASQDERGMMTYFMPLSSGSSRRYSNKFQNFTCCHGSGMESHTKHADSAYFHAGKDKLWVNLFIPSEVDWQEAGVRLRQETRFPLDSNVRLEVLEGNTQFELLVRHPGWAAEPFDIRVNGAVVARCNKPASYVSLDREWKKGDVVEFTLPMRLRTESMPDDPNRIAVLYGPVVLGAALGPSRAPAPRTPVLVVGNRLVSEWLRSSEDPLEFKSVDAVRPRDLVFKPFYELKHERYAVYFDKFDDAGWAKLEAEYRAEEQRQRDLEERTIDYCRIGEMQPERDHKLTSERNDVRESNGRGFRTPLGNGWFELQLKVDSEKPNDLVMTYWGSDRSDPVVEILVDGAKLATDSLPNRKLNAFFDERHPLPLELTRGKTMILLRVQAAAGKPAASVAGARTIRS